MRKEKSTPSKFCKCKTTPVPSTICLSWREELKKTTNHLGTKSQLHKSMGMELVFRDLAQEWKAPHQLVPEEGVQLHDQCLSLLTIAPQYPYPSALPKAPLSPPQCSPAHQSTPPPRHPPRPSFPFPCCCPKWQRDFDNHADIATMPILPIKEWLIVRKHIGLWE